MVLIVYLKKRMILLQEAQCIHDNMARAVGLCPTLMNLVGEKPIVLLAFLANLKDIFDNCGVRVGDAARDLAFSFCDLTNEVYEVYTANDFSTYDHVNHET